MAQVNTPFVGEYVQTTGTGAYTLGQGNIDGHKAFSTAAANADTVYYIAQNLGGLGAGEWEIGLGTYTSASNTLARTTVIASSNNNNAVSFTAGVKTLRTLQSQSGAAGAFTYTLTGTSGPRSLAATESTAANIAAFVVALGRDLQALGIIK